MTRASRGGLALYASSGRLDGHLDSVPPPDSQVPPPREVHEPYLPDDKLVLWPSQRRPLRRDLERLVAHFAGWDRPPHSLVARWRA